MRHPLVFCAAAVLLLPACGGSLPGSISKATAPAAPSSAVPTDRYAMANGCYALRAADSKALTVADAGGYAAKVDKLGDAEAFYLKPAALGQYLLYTRDKSLLAAVGSSVGSVFEPQRSAIWDVDMSGGRFQLRSVTAERALGLGTGGRLVLVDAPAAFEFVPATGCKEFPEMPVDVVGETYKGQGVDKPVLGFAEVHTHMAMAHEMSGGDIGTVGPSAGGTLYGQMFNNLGVTEALKDCAVLHGPNGIFNPDTVIRIGSSGSPLKTHDTQGWPGFIEWPTAESLTHQGMYYKWVERAYKAGLRIMVSHGTNIDALCQVGRAALSANRPANLAADCDDMSLGVKQVKYLREMQDYVDAQEGGPGKGWFRIVGSPAEARAVINDGKLAVVPGVEFAHMFNCNVTVLPGGIEQSGCDQAEIDRQIDILYDLGVRQLFPYHDVDSALGGAGIFSGDVINLLNFYDTKQFWQTYDCPDGGEGEAYFYSAGAVMTTAIPGTGNDPLTNLLIGAVQGPLPAYPAGRRQCNARGMTDLGRYAIQRLMEKKIIIDIDHAEISIKQDMLDMARAQTPAYPMLSAHGGHGGISVAQAKEILDMGGLIYPYKPNGRGHSSFIQSVKALANPKFVFGVGFGSDTNGFGGLAGPRGAGAEPVQYPITLFSGPGWGPQFAAAGIKPIQLNLLTIPESGKTWNIDETGMAHYGQVADFVEEVRLEGGEEAVTALYNSAEAYIQMWERVVNR